MRAVSSQKLPQAWGWLAPVLMALALGWLGWQAWRDPKIQFLPPGSAGWIVYPSPARTHALDVRNLPAEFHGQLVLAWKPSQATLDWRCFRQGRLSLNGQVVSIPATANWKIPARIEVADQLHQGTNDILATVWADSGPPAVSLRLQTDEATLVTDEHWEVSLAGAIKLPASRAGVTVEPLAGNPLFGGERTGPAIRRTFWLECVFLAASLLAALMWRRLCVRIKDGGRRERRLRNFALAGLAAAWLALLAHNILCLTIPCGFDAAAHLDYIKYVQTNGSLPLANQGPEMFQAPLYYVISAGLLNAFHLAAADLNGLRVLRFFNLFVGAANISLVWFGLGLIYPGQWKKQAVGAVLAAFTPWQLYLLHYPTNEVLCGAIGTACLCLGLKCLAVYKDAGRTGWLLLLGAALGAGCLAKSSTLALLPVVFTALAGQLIVQKQRSPRFWLKEMGLVFGLALVIAGWHYWRAWRHFGNPLLGGWSREAYTAWWQQPGYVTLGYFTLFGRALVSPFFSGWHGFWDGLYSTLWGDGLCGGAAKVWVGTLWNFDFMTTGYVLALVPSFLLASGVVLALVRFVRKPQADWLLLGGGAAVYVLALSQISLKLPYLACGKAFFALPAMLPFCAFIVAGFEFWTKRLGSWAGLGLAALLGLWLINDFAAFWIRPDAPRTRFLLARQKYIVGNEDTAPDFQRLLDLDPHDGLAAEFLARAELQAGRYDRFETVVKQAMENNSINGELASMAAKRLILHGKQAEALELVRQTAHNAPDDEVIAQNWLNLAYAIKQDTEVVAAGEWLLRINPGSLPAHKMMAEALNHLGQPAAAAIHLSIVNATAF